MSVHRTFAPYFIGLLLLAGAPPAGRAPDVEPADGSGAPAQLTAGPAQAPAPFLASSGLTLDSSPVERHGPLGPATPRSQRTAAGSGIARLEEGPTASRIRAVQRVYLGYAAELTAVRIGIPLIRSTAPPIA